MSMRHLTDWQVSTVTGRSFRLVEAYRSESGQPYWWLEELGEGPSGKEAIFVGFPHPNREVADRELAASLDGKPGITSFMENKVNRPKN